MKKRDLMGGFSIKVCYLLIEGKFKFSGSEGNSEWPVQLTLPYVIDKDNWIMINY